MDGSRPRIIDRSMPDRARVMAANIDVVGNCQSVEQGLEATRMALSPPLVDNAADARTPQPNDGNRGLVRPDAALAVVVVSDEDDESPGSLSERLRGLRLLKRTSPMSLSAIVAPLGGCPSAAEAGMRYISAAQATGGVVASVCEPDWSANLAVLVEGLFRPRDRYLLDAEADPTSLVVTVDGLAASGWSYDAGARAVVFATPPPAGAEIRIQYQEPCP